MRRALAGLLLLALVACGDPATDDLEPDRYEVVDPDRAIVYRNANLFPNLMVVCIEGAALVTTTREMDALLRLPEADGLCRA